MLHAAAPKDPTVVEFSHSQVELFLQCQRKWFYRKVLNLPAGDDAPPLLYGKAGHEGLGALFSGRADRERMISVAVQELKTTAAMHHVWYEKARPHLEAQLAAFYDSFYGAFMKEWEVVSTEEYWDVAPAPGCLWRGYIDLVARNRYDGRIAIFDHKFSSKDYIDKLSRGIQTSHQLANYVMAWVRKSGQWPGEVGYIFFEKLKMDNNPKYSGKHTKLVSIPVTPQFAQFAMGVEQNDVHIAERMRQLYIAYRDQGPATASQALADFSRCHDFFSECPFFSGCSSGNPIHNRVRIP